MRIALGLLFGLLCVAPAGAEEKLFRDRVAAVLEKRCVNCHNSESPKGGLSLQSREKAIAGGESGAAIVPSKPEESLLVGYISGEQPEMPKKGPPLTKEEIGDIRQWIADGAKWPRDLLLQDRSLADRNWWSLQPLVRPELPKLTPEDATRVRTPVDAFILAKLREKGLSLSPEAGRSTLIRRLYFDLVGLPPTPEEVSAFEADTDPRAYEKLVDRLLESPRYGERWARHWLDVVHYADTHGYDKDKLRPNAWPYRDYVIRALNEDKPYERFVLEQLAGDVLFGDTVDGNVAVGFISAGPWDFVGHAEVPEDKIDGKIARNLDRDDMVMTTMNTFCSVTTQCARCHNHKFDPVTMDDYYSLQAVFAAVDRADKQYDADPKIARQRVELERTRQQLAAAAAALDKKVKQLGGDELARVDARLAELSARPTGAERPEFGFHSAIEPRADISKWVQIDLGKSQPINRIAIVGCNDDFNSIGAGFGFPVRYKIEVSDYPTFGSDVTTVADYTQADVANPGVRPQIAKFAELKARYVRVTATKLAPRMNDFIFSLAELLAYSPEGTNVAQGAVVTSQDSIEAPVRWGRRNLTDGYYYGVGSEAGREIEQLQSQREAILARVLEGELAAEFEKNRVALKQVEAQVTALPPRQLVYAGTVHTGSGTFVGRGANGGKPREIQVLVRGEVTKPGNVVEPGVPPLVADLPSRFSLAADHREGDRRAALASWIADKRNPLTWRSIVNRVWQYHLGRAIVDSPNDFGRMGQMPSHPELLDWLAAEFRDGRQSLKDLHRLIVNSATYRQSAAANADFEKIDSSNVYLWRWSRKRLDAECVRDATLQVAGKLDPTMGGPGYWDFVLEKPENSPHFQYHKQDPDDAKTHRRSIYRFIVRSAPDPFMETLDCADPSQMVEKRNETINALSALTLMNNKFMVRMSEHFASRVATAADDRSSQVKIAFRLAIGREPTREELAQLSAYADEFGLPNACRVILNLNEFVFVD
jgi:multidrug efflux pump subunit AcrA (membrane-fusion protein)/mono/diheme cytochrome c family protein